MDVADQNGRTACGIPTCGVLKLQGAWYNWLKPTAKAPCKLVIRERNEDVQQNSMYQLLCWFWGVQIHMFETPQQRLCELRFLDSRQIHIMKRFANMA